MPFGLVSQADFDRAIAAIKAGHGELLAFIKDQNVKIADLDSRLKALEKPGPTPPPPPPPPDPPSVAHRPWQLFGGKYDGSINEFPGLTGSIYARFNLGQVIDPGGAINLTQFHNWRLDAKSLGMKLAVRFMCVNPGNYEGPTWMRSAGWPGKQMTYGGRPAWHPDISYQPFQQLMAKLYQAVAQYSSDLEYVDLGWWGISGGECHFNDESGQPMWKGPNGESIPFTPEVCIWSQNVVIDALPKELPKLASIKRLSDHRNASIGCKAALERSVSGHVVGIRIDGLDAFHRGFKNSDGSFSGRDGFGYVPDAIRDMGITDPREFWKKAPVAFEPAGVASEWDNSNYEPGLWQGHNDYVSWLRPAYMHNKSLSMGPGIAKMKASLELMKNNRGAW